MTTLEAYESFLNLLYSAPLYRGEAAVPVGERLEKNSPFTKEETNTFCGYADDLYLTKEERGYLQLLMESGKGCCDIYEIIVQP